MPTAFFYIEFDAEGDVINGDDFTSWTPIGWYDNYTDSTGTSHINLCSKSNIYTT